MRRDRHVHADRARPATRRPGRRDCPEVGGLLAGADARPARLPPVPLRHRSGHRATAAVTIWDDKPDDALVERLMSEFRATLGMSAAQAPEATLYEVVVE